MSFYNPAQHPLVRQSMPAQASDSLGALPRETAARGRFQSTAVTTESGSSVVFGEEEWVLFSAAEGSSVLDYAVEDDEEDEGNDEQEMHGDQPGAAQPVNAVSYNFSFPQLDGNGSYAATPRANNLPLSPSSSFSSDDVTARINAWRLDQSEHLLRELQRLQVRSASRRSGSISSWGIPAEEAEIENEADAESFDRVRLSFRDSEGLTDSFTYDTASFECISPVGATESVTKGSLLESQRRSGSFASSTRLSPSGRRHTQSISGDEGPVGFWTRFTRRVIHDIMGINDEVLDVLFGDRFIDPSGTVTPTATSIHNAVSGGGIFGVSGPHSEKSSSVLSSTNSRKYWEDRLIARIGRELSLRYCKDYGSVEICNGLFT
ncbi:hypothetical protein V1525DRAFT_432355 [Lipomyces kononenkoae]|uniref:Uncharacterized protein n=1 Tax=Lipomyces kononenkoae TaxID=34357 RepID=A0ACC3T2N9_LIPKO